MKNMIPKSKIRERLSTAVGTEIDTCTFSWFFGYYVESLHRPQELIRAKTISINELQLFGTFCGYRLELDHPTPLMVQI